MRSRKDWLVQNETHDTFANTLRWNEIILLPLTLPDYRLGGVLQENYRLPEVSSITYTLAVSGAIFWWLYPVADDDLTTISSVNFLTMFGARIRVGPVDPSVPDVPALEPTYDPRDAPSSNELYLWQRQTMPGNVSPSVLGGGAQKSAWSGMMPVSCKVGRSIETGFQLQLCLWWGQICGGVGNGYVNDLTELIELRYCPRVRTLVSLS